MARKAYLNLRGHLPQRTVMFTKGLERVGYSVQPFLTHKPDDGDCLVTWNRIGDGDTAARAFESMGLPVLVTENALWGNTFAGHNWYALGRNFHNLKGCAPYGGPERWDALGKELMPLRGVVGHKTLVLMQRGIGPTETRQPFHFRDVMRSKFPAADIREHPGARNPAMLRDLIDVLPEYEYVATWASAGGITARWMGLEVFSYLPSWIGAGDDRLEMFRRLAWATARFDEIESGEAFARLLS